RRLCNKSILIQQKRFIKALLYRIRACQYRIDILSRNLSIDMKRLWTWTFNIRDIDAQKVLPQIRSPFPGSQHNIGVHRTRQMHIRTRKYQWPNIGRTQVIDLQQLITLFDQGVDIPMKREINSLTRPLQPIKMLLGLENPRTVVCTVRPEAFKGSVTIVERLAK